MVSQSLDIIVISLVCDNSDIIQMNYFFSEEAFENLISQQSLKKEKFLKSYQFPIITPPMNIVIVSLGSTL